MALGPIDCPDADLDELYNAYEPQIKAAADCKLDGIIDVYKRQDYKELDRLKYLLSLPENSFIRQLETIYAERPVLKMLIKKADAENAREKLNKYLSGRLILNISEAGYMPWQTDIK